MKIRLQITLERCRRLSEGGIRQLIVPVRVHEIAPIEVTKAGIIAAVAEF